MKHAEVIFEPGAKSVVSYESEDELKSFLSNHHNRAVRGDVGGPTGHPAERVTKVLLYDQHPANYGVGNRLDAASVNSLIQSMASDGQVDVFRLIAALRDEVSPVYPQDQGRHESQYKMPESDELDLSFLSDDNAPEGGAV